MTDHAAAPPPHSSLPGGIGPQPLASPLPAMPRDLATLLALWPWIMAILLGIAIRDPDPAGRMGALAALACSAVVVRGMTRCRCWAAPLGSLLLLALATWALFAGLQSGFSAFRLIAILYLGLWAYWGLLPSTWRRLGAYPAGWSTDPRSMLIEVLLPLTLAACFLAGAVLPVPGWLGLLFGLGLTGLLPTRIEQEFSKRLVLWIELRPGKYLDSVERRLHSASVACVQGDLDHAASELAGLPDSRGVRLLRALVETDPRRAACGLWRVILQGYCTLTASMRTDVRDECRAAGIADLRSLVEARACLVEELLQGAPAWSLPLPRHVERLQERLCFVPEFWNRPFHRLARWPAERTRSTGTSAVEWLVTRLWEAWCCEAALEVARMVAEPETVALAELAALAQALRPGEPALPHLLAQRTATARCWQIAEARGWLRLDSAMLTQMGPDAAAAIVNQRPALLRELLRLWKRHPREMHEVGALVARMLTGWPGYGSPSRARFLVWWARAGPRIESFDAAFALGLRASGRGAWDEAAQAFGTARAAVPEFRTAAWNQGHCLQRLAGAADSAPEPEGADTGTA